MQKPWTQTMDLKFEGGILYQRWYRIRHHSLDTKRGEIQHQWRPIRGQGGGAKILASEKGE